MTLANAIRLATLKHGQSTDKGGQPFIGHPLRVMAMVAVAHPDAPEYVLEAAVCHDVLEDTGTDYREMITSGIDRRAIYLVRILSRNDEVETYWDYIGRVKIGAIREPEGDILLLPKDPADPAFHDLYDLADWAVAIKLCDLADNMNPQRRVEGLKLVDRYERAAAMLKA